MSHRRPIFQRVSRLLKVSILRRRPIIPRLKLIPIKRRRSSQRVKLLHQYNYKFLQEYQFSPSHSSLICCCRKRIQISRSGLKRIYKLLLRSRCICCIDDTIKQSWMEMEMEMETLNYALASPARKLPQPLDYFSEDDDSIDLKAERFIEKFYDEMRMQAREFA